MVEGLDRFADHFASYTDRYALIGGAACDLAMQMAAQPFRATKDLDIVLLLETLDTVFVAAFWDFVRQARYQSREREPERRQFYRFTRPEAAGFPSMLELFARRPDAIGYEGEGHLTPIPMDGTVSSLSAILLDNDYYDWIRAGKQMQDSLSFVRAEHLIPLKARAWIDLSARKSVGESVSSTDVKKHRNDVFRLLTIVDPEYVVTPPGQIATGMETFLNRVPDDPPDLRSLGIRGMSLEEAVASLRDTYLK